MSNVKSGSLMQKRYHIGPSSHFNFKRLFKDCSHVLSKCWAQSPCSLFKSGESRLRSRLLGNAEEEWAPVWVVFGCRGIGNMSWDFYTLTLKEGLPVLYICIAQALQDAWKQELRILCKYPCPRISWRMSVRAELGARGRSTFGKRYFWTACIHILEYLLCIPLWWRAHL